MQESVRQSLEWTLEHKDRRLAPIPTTVEVKHERYIRDEYDHDPYHPPINESDQSCAPA